MSKDIKLSRIITDLESGAKLMLEQIDLGYCASIAEDQERDMDIATLALNAILAFEEAINPHAMGMSPTWVIANRALEQLEGE